MSIAWYGYDNACDGASFGETISNCDSSRLGRLSYESPDVRGTLSAEPFRGGDAPAMSREGARDDEESVEDMLGRWRDVADMRPLAFDSCDWRLFERDWLARCSGSAGLRGMSTSVIEEETPEARFMTDPSSTTLPFRRRVSCTISELERGVWPIEEEDECVERLPDCDLKDFRIDLRAPFSPCISPAGADAGSGGVIAGGIEGEGWRGGGGWTG